MPSGDNTTGGKPGKSTRRSRKGAPRSALSYYKSAKKLAKLAPSLEKYTTKEMLKRAKQGKLSPAAKAAITRKEKLLRHTENLHPISKAEYKKAKKLGIAAGKGLQAVRLRNTDEKAKVRVTKDGLKVGTNGRAITYEIVEPPELENLIDAAARAFNEELEIEYDDDGEERTIEVVRYGKESKKITRRKKKYNVTVWLWTIAGRASRGFRSLELFIEDISKAFEAYKQQADWIRGIAWLKE